MKKLFTLLLIAVIAFTFKAGAQSIACNAGFDVSITNQSVHFTFSTTGESSQIHSNWNFGDGAVSSDLSPIHLYNNPGTYTIRHIIYRTQPGVANATCIDTAKKVITIGPVTQVACNLHAIFSFERDPSQPGKIMFHNLSTPSNEIHVSKWSFGDGSYSSDFNTSHVYTTSGLYTVCLSVQTNICVKDTCIRLLVQVPPPPCNLIAYFSYQFDPANNNKVYFVNQSTPSTSAANVQWSFGDGTNSTSLNPDHVYAHPGTYNVCVHVSAGTGCTKEFCKTIEIKEPEISCAEISKFTVTRSTANCLEFKFAPVNQNPNWKYVWNFGDGTNSSNMVPGGLVYPHSGNYTVTLTVYRSSTCSSSSHQLVETGTCFSCNNIWVKYDYRKESVTSNKFFFHALSNYPVLSQSWTIKKLNVGGSAVVTLTGLNTDYTFREPGDYVVCLRAITSGNCVKEYCEVIHIIAPNTECTLTAFPNPASNQVTFSLQLTQSEVIHVYIYNSLNILMRQKEQLGYTGNNSITANLENLVPGTYNVKVIYGNRICYSKFQKL